MSDPIRGDELTGKTLGQFEIQDEIGRGGMATVYRARQLSMNRMVAVKVLPRHLLHDPGFYERFLREVEVITQLEHPHILPIYDYGQVEGIPFIAMRYLGGGSLEQTIRRGLPPLDSIEKPLRQIAQALDHAHKQGIIHRDLKPGNIMLDEHGNAYLSDFGIARVLGSQLTGSLIVGTPTYMSPEQANGVHIDGRSDVYALGVVLFELLTGRAPYQAETPMAVLLKHIKEPMPPVSRYRSNVPEAVNDVVQKATAKEPDDRYPSASAMIDALQEAFRQNADEANGIDDNEKTFIGTDDELVRPAGGTTRAPSPKTRKTDPQPDNGTAVISPPVVSTESAPRRNTAVIGGVLVVLAVIVGALVMVLANPAPVDLSRIPATPFARAGMIEHPRYSLSIPSLWIPAQEYLDRSDDERMVHIWQADDSTAFVTLAILESEVVDQNAFRNIVDTYDNRFYRSLDGRDFVSEDVAPNGVVRRSYRLDGTTGFPPGQMDVFYVWQGQTLAVLEVYTADSTLNDLVPTLQQVLDSLRVRG